jgi:hypothetical protein
MLTRMVFALIAAVVLSSASAALAQMQPTHPPVPKPGCITDEGQGRFAPCSYGGAGG